MNNYDLIEVIGEGTYGIVYKCRDRRTNRVVAVKQFKNFQTNAYIRCTMLRELRVEQLLKGEPNVTQLLETFKQKNRLYLVMEYIPRSLLDVLEEHRTGLAEDHLVLLLYTLLLGIQSCHRNGIIHRDIKPENILVRGDGTASLCDFGFCRPVLQQQQQLLPSQLTAPSSSLLAEGLSQSAAGNTNSAVGTTGAGSASSSPHFATPPAGSTAASAFLSELVLADHRGVMTDYVATRWYRSPEMLLGMPNYGYAVDMWAVGAIMAEVIDGEPLLPGKTELEQLALIQTRVGEFPAAYEAAVRKRNGGMLHLRSADPLAKSQSQVRVKISIGDSGEESSRGEEVGASSDAVTISGYLSMRYGSRISKTGMELLARLLCVDADSRITVEEALAHPYFDHVRGDSRFTTPDMTPQTATKDASADQEGEVQKEGQESSTAAFTRQATSSTVDITASAKPLPPLSPVAPSITGGHEGFLKAMADNTSSSGGTARLFQRAEQGKIAGRPPRAADADTHAANDTDASAGGSVPNIALLTPSSSSVWQSATSSPRLLARSQQSGAPLPPLEGNDAASANAAAAEGIRHDEDNDDNDGSDADGNSPPPRPVLQQGVPGSSPLQRRHAASEGANGSTPTTTAERPALTATQTTPNATTAFVKHGSHASTLLFKTKKGKPTIDNALGQRRSSQSEESAAGGGTPLSSRFTHSMMASSVLAPLRRRRSGQDAALTDTEEEKTQPSSRHASPTLPLPTFAAESLVGKNSKGHPAAHDDALFFDKSSVCPREVEKKEGKDKEVDGCMSAPRSGAGDKQAALGDGAHHHQRTSSYTAQPTQPQRTQGTATTWMKTKKSARRAMRPGLRPSHPSPTAQSDSMASSSGGGNALPLKRQASTEFASPTTASSASAAAATERPSAKQQGASPPRQKTAQRSSGAAGAPVSARNRAGKQTPRKSTPRWASPERGTASPTAARKRAAAPSAVTTAADKSRFASPKLPRVVKPLQPRERMTLLKEIESLGCPVETPSAVEVMLPTHSSPSVKDERLGDNEDEKEVAESKDSGASGSISLASSMFGQDARELLAAAGVSQLTADGDELFVGDLNNVSVSRSPLLSEVSEVGDEFHAGLLLPPMPSVVNDVDVAEADLRTSATATACTQSRPPRMDFGYSTSNFNSNRAPPSLYFRSSRVAPTPLKLVAHYVAQSAGPSQLLATAGPLGGGNGGASAEGTSSPPALSNGGPALAAVQSYAPTSSLSPSFCCRPTPTLLRHPQSKASATSLSSPLAFPLELPNGFNGSGKGGGLQPAASSHGPNLSFSRTQHDDSPRIPVTSSLPSHKMGSALLTDRMSGPQPHQLSSEDAAPADVRAAAPQQRRLSANYLSLSVGSEFTHAGSGALSRRSQERGRPHAATTATGLLTPPTANVDEIETEVLVATPLTSPLTRQENPNEPTPSPPCRNTTTVMSGRTTCETSALTPQRSISRGTPSSASARRRESSNRPASAANLKNGRSPGKRSTPFVRGSLKAKLGDGGGVEDEELPSAAQTISFPLHSSGDCSVSAGEATHSTHEGSSPLLRHPPQPVLGGVWVNVGGSGLGHGPQPVPSRKKSRLLL